MAQATAAKPPGPKTSEDENLSDALMGTEHIVRIEKQIDVIKAGLEKKIKEVKENEVPVKEDRYRIILVAYFALATLILVASIVCFVSGIAIGSWGLNLRHFGFIGILAVGIHAWLSIRKVRIDDWVGLKFFGGPIKDFREPGPAFAPAGITEYVHEPRVGYQDLYPGPAESVVHFEADPTIPSLKKEKYEKGEVRPIIVMTGLPTPREQKAINSLTEKAGGVIAESIVLFKQSTVEVSFWVFWRVENQFLYDRVIPGDTPTARRKQVISRLRKLGESELKEILSKLTPATVNQCWEKIGEYLTVKLQEIALEWGVEISRAALEEMNLSHKTHQAQAEAVRAAFTKIKTIRDAEGERVKREKEGEGKGLADAAIGAGQAKARQSMLEAEAAGGKKVMDSLGITGEEAYSMQLTAEALRHANYSMFGTDGARDLLSIISAGKSIPPAGTKRNPQSDTSATQPSKDGPRTPQPTSGSDMATLTEPVSLSRPPSVGTIKRPPKFKKFKQDKPGTTGF